MEVSTIILFSLLLCGVKPIHADESLSPLATRVRLVEGELNAWKLTSVNTEIKLINKLEVLESSLKGELTTTFLPPLIKPLVRQAITDILTEDYIGNIINARVLHEVQSLKSKVKNTKTQLKALRKELRHVERERDTYRESLGKQRGELTKHTRALQLQLNQTLADLCVARVLQSELNQTNNDLFDTKKKIAGLTEDFITLNTSCVMMINEVESCTDGLQEIRLKLPTDIQSLTTQLNQTNDDLFNTKQVLTGLTEDLMTLNISCGMRKEIKPSEGNESSLTTSSLSQVSTTTSTTTYPETTAASTDPSPSTTVPPAPVTTQDSDPHATTSPAADRDLYSASRDGDLERVKRILSAGHVDINTKSGSNTPVMVAALRGHRDVVEFLVGRGADVSLVSSSGYNILHYACMGGDLETVKWILSLNVVDINSRGWRSRTPVMEAAYRRHRDVVEFLVDRGAGVSLVDRYGNSILHYACLGGDLETVKLILLLNVVDINSRGADSWTPVMAAAYRGYRDVVEFLVGRGAGVSLVDRVGNNAFHLACLGGHLEIVKLILSLNVADINARNNDGKTAADNARDGGHQRVVDLLVSRGGL